MGSCVKSIIQITRALFLSLMVALPAVATTAGGARMVYVADTRTLTGLRAWWANLYNESHLYFALATVILVPCAGAILGTLADLVMGRLGIDLKSRVLRES
jgi:hypothetical protein